MTALETEIVDDLADVIARVELLASVTSDALSLERLGLVLRNLALALGGCDADSLRGGHYELISRHTRAVERW